MFVCPKPTVFSLNLKEDEPSARGRFGWTIIGKVILPYILRRDGTKFVSEWMIRSKPVIPLSQYFNIEYQTSAGMISRFRATQAEVALFNYINSNDVSDYHFGYKRFEENQEFIIKLDDILELHSFISSCFYKLISPVNGTSPSLRNEKFGFIRIDQMSVVPFVTINSTRYLPAFYFEGDKEFLMNEGIHIKGWELAYLKFCCKVQGIRKEYFDNDNCFMIPLEEIKLYFSETTKFEDYWPIEDDLKIIRQEALRDLSNEIDSPFKVPSALAMKAYSRETVHSGLTCSSSSPFSIPSTIQNVSSDMMVYSRERLDQLRSLVRGPVDNGCHVYNQISNQVRTNSESHRKIMKPYSNTVLPIVKTVGGKEVLVRNNYISTQSRSHNHYYNSAPNPVVSSTYVPPSVAGHCRNSTLLSNRDPLQFHQMMKPPSGTALYSDRLPIADHLHYTQNCLY